MSTEFISFFIILFAGLFLSGIFKRLHLPWVAALIIAGIAIGPSGVGWFVGSPAIDFIAEIGLVFLMFMAGFETRFSEWQGVLRGALRIALFTSATSFMAGFMLMQYLGYDLFASALIGIIFVSASVAVIMPTIAINNLSGTRIGKTIVGAALIVDVLSLILLSVLLQNFDPVTAFPLYLFYPLLLAAFVILRKLIPAIHSFFHFWAKTTDPFEKELRLIFTVMLGTVVLFHLLGLHAIIAGFFAGFVLSDQITNENIKNKLHTLAYGIFIPTFFIMVGVHTNIGLLVHANSTTSFALLIIAALFAVKLFGAFVGGKISDFNTRESVLVSFSLTPLLSTALAAGVTGFEIGIIDERLLTTIVALSITTTLFAPLAIAMVTRKISKGNI